MKSSGIKFLIGSIVFFFFSIAWCIYFANLPSVFLAAKRPQLDINPNMYGFVGIFGSILVYVIHKFYYKGEKKIERYILTFITFNCLSYVTYAIIMKPYF